MFPHRRNPREEEVPAHRRDFVLNYPSVTWRGALVT